MDDDGDLVLYRRMKRHSKAFVLWLSFRCWCVMNLIDVPWFAGRRNKDHVLTVQHGVTSLLRSVGLLAREHSVSDFLLCIILLSFVVHCLLLLVYMFGRQPCC
uniref:Uncharacterized protein n=1 Tax=Triticum urartu TaxID=4572 RepID=A0A8R7K357_TRIUA